MGPIKKEKSRSRRGYEMKAAADGLGERFRIGKLPGLQQIIAPIAYCSLCNIGHMQFTHEIIIHNIIT